MRTAYRGALWALAMALVGCNGQGTQLLSPTLSGGSGLGQSVSGAVPGPAIIQGDEAQSALAIYSVNVDLGSLTATSSLARSGAASDNTYELPLASFMKPQHFEVVSVNRTPTTLDLTYRVTHPIPAPTNLDAPPTAANRADLGAIMRVLFLGDVTTATGNTFFAGSESVIAETTLVANPHGYFTPKGLLKLGSSAIANTFPYRLVVDEAANSGLGNRDGIPGVAGTFGQGNYAPTEGGWQRSNMGADRTGWTGFGMLHQGQSATSTVRINLANLQTAGSFSFDAALTANYIDPRGGTTGVVRRSNRLPAADGDQTRFAYRMPYGALDCELVRFAGESGGFDPENLSFSVLNFHVRDFDARAIETTVADLAIDPNVNFVQQNGSGAPSLTVDIPSVIPAPVAFDGADLVDDDSAFGGDAAPDSGMAGDELFFSKTITKPGGTSLANGFYTGMVRVEDVSASDPERSSYYFAVDDALQPLASGLIPAPVTYQSFRVLVTTPNATPQTTVSFVGGSNQVASGGTTEVQVNTYSDGENDPSTFQVDYDFDGTFFTDVTPVVVSPGDPLPIPLGESPRLYNRISADPIMATVQVWFTDGFHPDQIIDLPVEIGGNSNPTADVEFVSPTAVVSTIIRLNITNESDVENDAVRYDIDWDWDGDPQNFLPDFPWIELTRGLATLPNSAPDVIGSYTAGVRVKDALHPQGVLVSVPYQIVPTNQQATLTFSMPSTVQSAETLSLTVATYDDPDGDPVQIKIDWNGDLDFNDPGESGLVPVTAAGQVYTSPVLINNTSASPLAPRSVYVEYTDNISPHVPIYTSPGQYTLGGNRPPVVIGAPALELTPIASGSSFRVLQNGATVSDPEGNAISFTVRSVPSSGAASNLTYSNFTNMRTPAYTNTPVSSVNITVYANDSLHATTNGTAFPGPLVGVICPDQVVQYTFDGSGDGWTPGQLFAPALPNNDGLGWSAFQWCVGMGNGMSGNMWTTGPDAGEACDFRRNDYGPNLDNNVVSPSFSLVGLSRANVVFNSSKTGRLVTCRYRIHVSTNGGSSWTQIYDTVRTGATSGTLNESNVAVSLNAYVGQPNVRLRFQMVDTSTQTFGAEPYTGWSFDNVRISGCP